MDTYLVVLLTQTLLGLAGMAIWYKVGLLSQRQWKNLITLRAGIWVDGFSGMALETSLFIMQKKFPQ